MIYLHKLLPLIVSPLILAMGLTIFGALSGRRRLVLFAVGLLYLFSLPIISKSIFGLVEGRAFRVNPQTLPVVDAIVVLSGMLTAVPSDGGLIYEWNDPDRFFGGIELFKLGKSESILFTGGTVPWQSNSRPEGEILSEYAQAFGVPKNNILLTSEVQNTEDEAAAVKKLLGKISPTIVLVTSAFHMPRAQKLFEKNGMKVTPFAVDFKVGSGQISPMDFFRDPGALALFARLRACCK